MEVDVFSRRPYIAFSLSWNQCALQSKSHPAAAVVCTEIVRNNHFNGRTFDFRNSEKVSTEVKPEWMLSALPKQPKRIFYQFLFNNNSRQQTEARDDLVCQWCYVTCPHLFALLSHLRCCHARFNFTYAEHHKGVRIDVAVNDSYDGSYVGNPQDLHSHVGMTFSRNGPVRRIPVTIILVVRNKCKKPSFDLSEFQEPEAEGYKGWQIMQGHNRLYFHSMTCQPIRPSEIDVDSEDENDPEWLRQKTQHLIDEFTDVNEGEKELMKLWNLHVMHYNYIGDCRLATACEAFVTERGADIVRRKLGRNLILHLVNLSDFGLIRPEIVYRIAIHFFHLRRQLEDCEENAVAW